MTSMPASRRARAMIFAPRSCPSSPGLATTTRILRLLTAARLPRVRSGAAPQVRAQRERQQAQCEEVAAVAAGRREGGTAVALRAAPDRPAPGVAPLPAGGTGVVAPAGRRPLHGHRALHLGVRRADVAERAGLVERVRAPFAGREDPRVE